VTLPPVSKSCPQEAADPAAAAGTTVLVKLERHQAASATAPYPSGHHEAAARRPHYTDLQTGHGPLVKPSLAAATAVSTYPQQHHQVKQHCKEGEEVSRHERDKKNIYKHPLFPLLALLFEKERFVAAKHTEGTGFPFTQISM
jgi:hypothetical protein